MTEQPFTLMNTPISEESVEALKSLLKDAKQGSLVGLAYVAMYTEPDRHFTTGVTGETHRNPVFTSGMLLSLNYQLMKKVNE